MRDQKLWRFSWILTVPEEIISWLQVGIIIGQKQKHLKHLESDYYGLSLLVASLLTGIRCEGLTAVKTEISSLEGSSVTLSYNYPNLQPGDYFFWYRQYPGEPPEFLISHGDKGSVLAKVISKLQIHIENKRLDLLISSAAVTDSAVYYCALKPTVTGNTRTLYKNLQYSTTSTRGPHTLLNQRGRGAPSKDPPSLTCRMKQILLLLFSMCMFGYSECFYSCVFSHLQNQTRTWPT
ncbi:PREDICTED: uncharacterized protein LOC107104846 [Cyprinodon variegatus]|uniref:uncharacterized protein LOC107104846 n=1 Tax=Cyprinodon variegatus TaxID=28743 RepID=UPI000742C84E|nr:PREDICTED: uncharacterized protein LOC107104846 [Cyprinodon variegatus]